MVEGKPMYHNEEESYHGWGLILPDPLDVKGIEHENEQIGLISIDIQDLKKAQHAVASVQTLLPTWKPYGRKQKEDTI